MPKRQRYLSTAPVSCLLDCKNGLGEGCIWDEGRKVIWWVEMTEPCLHQFDPNTGGHRVWPSAELITSLAVRTNGTLVVARKSGLGVFNPANGEFTHLVGFPVEEGENRPNDSGVDSFGRLWLGTVHDTLSRGRQSVSFNKSAGALYRIEPDLRLVKVESQIGIANAVQWSPDDRTLYFVDSLAAVIYAYDFEPQSGSISNRRVFSRITDLGLPDGAAMDADGCLWSARWDGSCVVRLSPSGEVDRIVPIPSVRVTCCTFGGDGLDTLYVTTARFGLPEKALAQGASQGGLFAVRPGVKGLPRNRFRG